MSPARSDIKFLRSVVILFGVVLVLYLAVFRGIEYWRVKNGPWTLLFQTNSAGTPLLRISQPKLNVQEVQIIFEQETTPATNLPQVVVLDRPLRPLPFGQRLHEDLIQLPGAETINFFGHLVELSPRRLYANGQIYPWTQHQTLRLWPTNKPTQSVPAAEPFPTNASPLAP